MNEQNIIGRIIHNRRIELGLTLEKVGNFVGVSKSTVKKWESGFISNMGRDKIAELAKCLHLNPITLITGEMSPKVDSTSRAVRIPVFAAVPAGIPLDAIEDVIDFEEIPSEMAKQGEHFALRVKGDSMEPKISNGDVVIVRQQEAVDNGDLAVILVNGNDATLKRFYASDAGVKLVSSNPKYDPFFFTPCTRQGRGASGKVLKRKDFSTLCLAFKKKNLQKMRIQPCSITVFSCLLSRQVLRELRHSLQQNTRSVSLLLLNKLLLPPG